MHTNSSESITSDTAIDYFLDDNFTLPRIIDFLSPNVSSNSTNITSPADPCVYNGAGNLDVKFPLLVIVTPSFCLFGIVGNLLSILVLSRPRFRSTSTWYLIFLAIADLGVVTTCLLLYTVEILYDYYRIFILYQVWFAYVRFVYWLSHVSQILGVYLTVAAAVERYVLLRHIRISQCETAIIIACVFLLTLGLTATKLFELELMINDRCTGEFGAYNLLPSALFTNEIYVTVYSLWVSSVCFVFVPFFLLCIFNSLIAWTTTRSNSFSCPSETTTVARLANATSIVWAPVCRRIEERVRRRKSKEMTKVLMVVVGVFLVCNAPSVALSLLETMWTRWLQENDAFYSFARDAVNLLAVINASVNFVVYVIFDRQFRVQLKNMFCRRQPRKTEPMRKVDRLKTLAMLERQRREAAHPQTGVLEIILTRDFRTGHAAPLSFAGQLVVDGPPVSNSYVCYSHGWRLTTTKLVQVHTSYRKTARTMNGTLQNGLDANHGHEN